MSEGSGGKRLPRPPPGRQGRIAAPPPTPAQRLRQAGGFTQRAPVPEEAMTNRASQKLLENTEKLLLVERGRITAENGRVYFDGRAIGRHDGKKVFILYETVSQAVAIPPLMETMARDKGLVIYLEVTESSIEICAGKRVGQKAIHMSLKMQSGF